MAPTQVYPSSILVQTALFLSFTVSTEVRREAVKITILIGGLANGGVSLWTNELILPSVVDELIHLLIVPFLEEYDVSFPFSRY